MKGFVMRGGRMMNLDTYECLWDLCRDFKSLQNPSKTIHEEIVEFNKEVRVCAKARLVNKHGRRLDVKTMGFTNQHRIELLALVGSSDEKMSDSKITDWISPDFFRTNFWLMWSTMLAFDPWHSAMEMKRYMHRFTHIYCTFDTMEDTHKTVLNQYDSMVKPIEVALK